jgi:hypothetical protein
MLHGSWPAMQNGSGAGTATGGDDGASPDPSRGFGGEVVELALLLTSAEATALESAAQASGMTVARLLRSVVRESLARWLCLSPGLRTAKGEDRDSPQGVVSPPEGQRPHGRLI